jgi:hypothetical protein
MLVEVSGPCGTASNTQPTKTQTTSLGIHIGSAGERARPPVQSFFVPDQMNRTEPNWDVVVPQEEDKLRDKVGKGVTVGSEFQYRRN